MTIIGRHLLPDFWHRHPESESALRGLLAIVAAAEWHCDGDIVHLLGAAATPAGEGQLVVSDPDGRFHLSLRVNYSQQLVHIIAIEGRSHD